MTGMNSKDNLLKMNLPGITCVFTTLLALTRGQNVLFFATGEPVTQDVEVLNLASPTLPCPKPADFPHDTHSAVGTFIDDSIMVCSGFDDDDFEYTNKCFVYDFVSENWSEGPRMIDGRLRSMAVMLDEERWWVTGGAAGELGPYATTEIYQDGTFSYGPELPVPLFDHCITQINSTATFVAGGIQTLPEFHAWILDWNTDTWTEVRNIGTPREGPACGVLHGDEGPEVYLVGGNFFGTLDTTEIFNVNSGSWRSGPVLPISLTDATLFNYEDTFVLAGGNNQEIRHLDTLYQLDLDAGEWVLRPETLLQPRSRFVGAFIPDDYVDC